MSGKYSTDHPDEPLDCSLPQYTCSRAEKQLLRTCMNAATAAGMALGLQGATTGLLGGSLALPTGSCKLQGARGTVSAADNMKGMQSSSPPPARLRSLLCAQDAPGSHKSGLCWAGSRPVRGACAALAYLCSGEPGEATSEAINAGHKLLAATFVYGSSHAFDQIIYTGADPLRIRQIPQQPTARITWRHGWQSCTCSCAWQLLLHHQRVIE